MEQPFRYQEMNHWRMSSNRGALHRFILTSGGPIRTNQWPSSTQLARTLLGLLLLWNATGPLWAAQAFSIIPPELEPGFKNFLRQLVPPPDSPNKALSPPPTDNVFSLVFTTIRDFPKNVVEAFQSSSGDAVKKTATKPVDAATLQNIIQKMNDGVEKPIEAADPKSPADSAYDDLLGKLEKTTSLMKKAVDKFELDAKQAIEDTVGKPPANTAPKPPFEATKAATAADAPKLPAETTKAASISPSVDAPKPPMEAAKTAANSPPPAPAKVNPPPAADAPKSPVQVTEPAVTSAPTATNTQPKVDTPKPALEAAKTAASSPSADAPKPTLETKAVTSSPPVDSTKPPVEAAKPVTTSPPPASDTAPKPPMKAAAKPTTASAPPTTDAAPKPPVEAAKPAATSLPATDTAPKPPVEAAKPGVTSSPPAADAVPKPPVEATKPAVTSPPPAADAVPKTPVEAAKPAVSAPPLVSDTAPKPPVEAAKPAASAPSPATDVSQKAEVPRPPVEVTKTATTPPPTEVKAAASSPSVDLPKSPVDAAKSAASGVTPTSTPPLEVAKATAASPLPGAETAKVEASKSISSASTPPTIPDVVGKANPSPSLSSLKAALVEVEKSSLQLKAKADLLVSNAGGDSVGLTNAKLELDKAITDLEKAVAAASVGASSSVGDIAIAEKEFEDAISDIKKVVIDASKKAQKVDSPAKTPVTQGATESSSTVFDQAKPESAVKVQSATDTIAHKESLLATATDRIGITGSTDAQRLLAESTNHGKTLQPGLIDTKELLLTAANTKTSTYAQLVSHLEAGPIRVADGGAEAEISKITTAVHETYSGDGTDSLFEAGRLLADAWAAIHADVFI